jgi:hypothetical protein
MIQPAWDETVEPVSACRAREREHARERMLHAIALVPMTPGLATAGMAW